MASCFLTLFWDALCSFSILYFEIKKKKWLFFIYLLGTKNCFLMDMEESLFFSFQTKNKTQNTKLKKNTKVGNVNRFQTTDIFGRRNQKFCTTKVVMMQVTSSLLFVSHFLLLPPSLSFLAPPNSLIQLPHFNQSYVEECLFCFLSLFCDLWGWGVVLFSDFYVLVLFSFEIG